MADTERVRRPVSGGLDSDNPDVTTPEEIAAWRRLDKEKRGYPLRSYDLFLQVGRGDVVKRWHRQAGHFFDPDAPGGYGPILAYLELYLIQGFNEGVAYEIRNAERAGIPRAEVEDTMAIAFLHSISMGLFSTSPVALESLSAYTTPDDGSGRQAYAAYPEEWTRDYDLLKSGLDFSSPTLTSEEVEVLEKWYVDVTGEVPKFVTFLARHRPSLLKAYRERFENCVRAIPVQMLAYLLIFYETYRGHQPAIRDAVLLGRGLGMTSSQATDAIIWTMLYGGSGAVSNAFDAVEDVFASW
jgi:hypothetical protein